MSQIIGFIYKSLSKLIKMINKTLKKLLLKERDKK